MTTWGCGSARGADRLHEVHALERRERVATELQSDRPVARGDEVEGGDVRAQLGRGEQPVPRALVVEALGEQTSLAPLDELPRALVAHDDLPHRALAGARRAGV